MTDHQKLDIITDAFAKALIANPFEDRYFYISLTKRIAALMDAELKFQQDLDYNKFLMEQWGAEAN